MTRAQVLWLRRDLRLSDHPALAAAAALGPVLVLFVLDPALITRAGAPRTVFLLRTLRELDADLRRRGGGLVVRSGAPEMIVPAVVAECRASAVHVSADFAPYGRLRDARVATALGAAAPFVRTGSPYAVSPGTLRTGGGGAYKVFGHFYRAWRAHGWPSPAAPPARVEWAVLPGERLPDEPALPGAMVLPPAGERAASAAWEAFRGGRLGGYAAGRDRPDLDRTSRLSPYLRFGSLHPRTLLAQLGQEGEAFRRELAWREFYADVLHEWPESARQSFQPKMASMPWEVGGVADERFAAWQAGRTGYPFVDAGMRHLAAEGFMPNRVRMVTASFLVKDLHIDWRRGARHFMRLLVDGDLASNQHGWQWTAGTGTDAAPYFRVLNPVLQGKRFDPEGAYVRRWVPELAQLSGRHVHEPWLAPPSLAAPYAQRIVDHDAERRASLATYARLGGRAGSGSDGRAAVITGR